MPISRRPHENAVVRHSGRKSKRPSNRLAAKLSVELSVLWTDGQSAQSQRVELVAVNKPRRGRGSHPAWSVEERSAAARRIARGVRQADLAGLLAALAHPQRIQILLELLGGEATHRTLAKATGLKAGPLYHHLRELRMAGLIGPKIRDLYILTARGSRAILAGLAIEKLCR